MSKTSSNNPEIDRSQVLKMLIELDLPISELESMLKLFGFDSPPIATLRATHLIYKLQKFLSGEIDSAYLSSWADLLEVRDDVEFEFQNENKIKHALSMMANPVLYGELDRKLAKELVELLSSAPGVRD